MQAGADEAASLAPMLGTGPLGRSFLDRVSSCSVSICSGHGRCMPMEPGVVADVAADASTAAGRSGCQCFAGFEGADCSTAKTIVRI